MLIMSAVMDQIFCSGEEFPTCAYTCTLRCPLSLTLHDNHHTILLNFVVALFRRARDCNNIQGVPDLSSFHYCKTQDRIFWLIYLQVGCFCVSRGSTTVTLTQILNNAAFSSPKLRVRRGPSVLF